MLCRCQGVWLARPLCCTLPIPQPAASGRSAVLQRDVLGCSGLFWAVPGCELTLRHMARGSPPAAPTLQDYPDGPVPLAPTADLAQRSPSSHGALVVHHLTTHELIKIRLLFSGSLGIEVTITQELYEITSKIRQPTTEEQKVLEMLFLHFKAFSRRHV